MEVATVGTESSLGIRVFLGNELPVGRPHVSAVTGRCRPWRRPGSSGTRRGRERSVRRWYEPLHAREPTTDDAVSRVDLHGVKQRCCRWLLQTHNRVGADEFQLKYEFLAVMLGCVVPP